jgi:hypothetical protein
MADMNILSLKFLFALASSIPAVAPKRKTQIGRVALHILRGGMCPAPHGEERILRVSNHDATVGSILRDAAKEPLLRMRFWRLSRLACTPVLG